ncbi:hypothetical protein ABIA23_000647 [Sinorhizobium fredii]
MAKRLTSKTVAPHKGEGASALTATAVSDRRIGAKADFGTLAVQHRKSLPLVGRGWGGVLF